MDAGTIEHIKAIFVEHAEVKLAYLFGSQARGDTGPMSDYDFAVYIDGLDSKQRFDLKIDLMTALSSALKTDAVDVVVLNDTDAPELKYAIISEGIVLHEEEPYRVLVEPQILNEFFDFRTGLRQFHLTRT